jgi:DNA-directed RNA polymerase specialized sigma24 family protein
VQETFERAQRHWATIDHPPAWLFTVANRLVGVRSRRDPGGSNRRGRYPRRGRDPPVVVAGTVCFARRHRRCPGVVDAIRALPDRQRVTTYLQRVQSWSQSEIAGFLECSLSAVSGSVKKGTDRLRNSLIYLEARPASLEPLPGARSMRLVLVLLHELPPRPHDHAWPPYPPVRRHLCHLHDCR